VVGAKGISGFKEQVVPTGPNRCGAHVDPESPNDIANFVKEILSDDELREKMGENARERVLENYTLDSIAEETLDIYDHLIESK